MLALRLDVVGPFGVVVVVIDGAKWIAWADRSLPVVAGITLAEVCAVHYCVPIDIQAHLAFFRVRAVLIFFAGALPRSFVDLLIEGDEV